MHAHYGGHRDDVFDTEIDVDAKRRVALRVVERFDGEIIEVRELTSVQFDVAIDAEAWKRVSSHSELLARAALYGTYLHTRSVWD